MSPRSSNPSTLFARLRHALVQHAPTAPGLEPKLHAALTQLAAHPGKLVRAQLVLLAAEHHGMRPRAAEQLACAVEYYHTASLVLDDLPCMDDAQTRRGQPCVHRTHGEATGILASLALINRSYALAAAAFARESRPIREAASRLLERALGTTGLVGGQAWDLAFAQTDQSARMTSRIALQKTGALFTLAVELPALLARPSARELHLLRALAVYWGQLFQITDDLRDLLSSPVGAGKTTGRDRALNRPNLALALGVPAARARIMRLMRQSTRTLEELGQLQPRRWGYLRAIESALGTAPEAQGAAA